MWPETKHKTKNLQAGILPPSCNSAVKEIKQQSKRHEPHGCMEITPIVRNNVSHATKDRHGATNTVHQRDNIGEIKVAGSFVSAPCRRQTLIIR